MPEYRRPKVAGGTFFFTIVTYRRIPILTTDLAREILRFAWKNTQDRFPFSTDAICLLPNHIHCIWTLPEGDANFSIRWKEIKRVFTMNYLDQIRAEPTEDSSRSHRKEAAIWQRRFWEHLIRDDEDLKVHLNYIHINPVKHGLVEKAADWQWSSFHRYVQMGYYEKEWGINPDFLNGFAVGE
jgi:putative transposase